MTLWNVLSRDDDERAKALRSRVWLDGEEITDACDVADDEAGVVYMRVRDAEGRFALDEDGYPARAWKRGRVEIRDSDAGEIRDGKAAPSKGASILAFRSDGRRRGES